jgi:LuxR family maltose regulon positive regulatory protein
MKNITLLQTKFNRPRLPDNFISRPHLMERLQQGVNRKLTLICAPAGYGKSTLAAGWLETYPCSAAWLSLDEMDGDLYRFLTYMAAAVQTIFPDGCAQTLNLLQATQAPPPEYLTVTLINEMAALDRPFILILDDYHQIKQEAIHQFISVLIDNIPTPMQLVIISRETPPLPIPRLRANREILEIRPADLRFSAAESGAFLAQYLGAPLPVRLVEMLVERTEGWIAGLRLAALSLRGKTDYHGFVETFHGTNRYIMEYLLDEILMRQPQAVQEFLLQTSILNHLCGPLCDALTGQHDPASNGQVYLEQLQRANFLIISLDEENHWYRYHALLRDLLRHKLMAEANPQQVAALHARAAGWLAGQGLVEEALLHLLAAGDPLGAAQLVESQRHHLLNQDDWRTLDRWLALLPAGLLQQRPGLLMARAQVFLFFTFNLRAVPPLVQAAERLLSEPAAPLSQDEALLVGVELDVIKGCLECLQGQAARSFDHLQRALFRIPPEYAHWRGLAVVYFCLAAQMTGQGDIALQIAVALENEVVAEDILTVNLLTAQLLNFLLDGQVPKFIQLTEYALKLSERHNYVNMVASGHFLLGHGHYLLNNLEVAASHLAQAVEMRYHQHTRLAVDALALLALTHQARQQPAQAKKTIELLLDFARQNENMAILAVARSGQARIALQQGDIEAATRWLQTADLALDSGAMLHLAELPRLTYCRALIAQGTAAALPEAVEKLQAHLKMAEDTHNTLQIIQILSLQSLAYYAQGQVETALAALKRAVTLAQPGGFIRTFVDCGLPIAGLLRQLAGQGVAPDYVRQILAAFPDLRLEDKEIVNRKSEIVNDSLTNRELEILELLAAGLSNQEIARSLYVSILTVKSHTWHIYQKLGVKSRYQAVAKAKTLNLLPVDND